MLPSRFPTMNRRGKRRQLALAMGAAPIVLGFPWLQEAFRDPGTILLNWDVWLIFFALPFAAAIVAWRR